MPPPDTIPRLTDSDGVSPRVRRGFNQMADAVNSLLRSTELQRTKANEWTIGGGASIDSNLSVAGFFPRYLPGATPKLTGPNLYAYGGQAVTFVGNSTYPPGLRVQYIGSDLAVDRPPALLVEDETGADTFSVSTSGGVFAASSVTAFQFVGSGTGLTGVALLADDNTFTLGPNQFRTGGNANVGVQIRQNSGSQTANLFELTDSTGATVLASFSKNCALLTMPATFAIGDQAKASSGSGLAIGQFATASGATSTAVGFSAVASKSTSVALGSTAVASGTSAVAIGSNATASTTNAVAIGNTATCNQANAAALGGGVTLAADEFVWGNIQGLGAVAHFRLTGQSSVQARSMFRLTTAWVDSTDATRTVRATFGVNDSGAATDPREGLALESNGTGCTVTVGRDSSFQGCVVNEAGADADFRVEGGTDANLLFVDAGNDRVGVGTGSPATLLHVAGTTRTDGLRLTAAAELTIAAGAVTRTQAFHRIDTEADAATDDLDTVGGGTEGDILILRAENSSRDVVVKDGTGNLQLAGGDFTLDHVQDTITLIYDGSNWIEMCRSNNSA